MNKKGIKLAVRIILGFLALYIIITKVDLEKAVQYLGRANLIYLFLAFLSFFFSKILASYRLNLFYRTQGLHISERLNIKLNLVCMFYNLFIPLIGGEGYRAYWLKKYYPIGVKNLVTSALLDRASGLVALCLLSIVFFWFSSFEFEYQTWVLALLPLIYFAYWMAMRLFFKSFLPAFHPTNIYSFFVQLLQAVTTYFIILAIGIEGSPVDYIFVFLLSTFAFVLPMIGAREMAFVFGAEYLGLNMELSLAISLLFYLSLAVSSLIGSYYVLVPKSLTKEITS